MSEVQARSITSEGRTQAFDHGTAESVQVGGATIGRFTFHPGWRWSEAVKPLAGTDSCQVHHVGYAISGHLRVRTDEGSEQDIRTGDAYDIPPGHDGWVVGDETFLSVEFQGGA